MVTLAEKSEAEVLKALRVRFEKDGYIFVAHPTPELVPDFLSGYRPDALAFSENGSVIIEVKTNQGTDKKLAQIAARVSKQPGWKFQIFLANNFVRTTYKKQNSHDLSTLLDEFNELLNSGFQRAALLMGWAALEAFARALNPKQENGSRPMIPSEIIEWLTQSGHIDAPTSRILRHMIKTRNAIAHGDTDTELSGHELSILSTTLESLSNEFASTK